MHVEKLLFCAVLLSAYLIAASCGGDTPETSEKPRAAAVVLYAARDAGLMQAVLDAYTAETGVPILLTTESGQALIDRLTAERHKSTADLLLTDGVGHLWIAAEEDILRPTNSELLETGIPEFLQDPENLWFALLVYGRTIAYDKRVINPDELISYAGLGDDRWRGKLCLSSASDADNQALVAMLIAEHGKRSAELIVRAWIANLAMPVLADDEQIFQAIKNGPCGLGIVNSDDAARLERDHPESPVALFWPPVSSGGAYINMVGAAVSRHAGNPMGAKELLEWLLSDAGQKLLAGRNLEYPVSRHVPADDSQAEWSALPIKPMRISRAGFYHEDAVKLMERAGYARSDRGPDRGRNPWGPSP